METIVVEKTGPATILAVKQAAKPTAVPKGHVLVKNEYAGINYIDIYFRNGAFPRQLPFTPGQEGAGVVEQSESSEFKPGQRVGYLSGGSYAQYTVVPEEKMFALPEKVSTELAAAMILQGGTAIYLTEETYQVKKDDWVVVLAAAGGVGSLLCQLCKIKGARVIGTTSTAAKVKEIHADHVINTTDADAAEQVRKITNGVGAKVVYDGVGKATFDFSIGVLGKFGHYVTYGHASGLAPPLNFAIGFERCLSFHCGTLACFTDSKDAFRSLMQRVFAVSWKPSIHKAYSLQDAHVAHSDLESKRTTGKLLIRL